MKAWAKDLGVGQDGKGSIINFLADTHGKLTDALGLRMNHPGPFGVLGNHRCKRFSAYFDDGVMKVLNVADGKDDPAGDNDPAKTFAKKMLADLEKISAK